MPLSLKLPLQQHPYVPSSLKLSGWQPLVLSYERILAVFFGGAAVIGVLSYLLSGMHMISFYLNSLLILVSCSERQFQGVRLLIAYF